ncbi:hypothetical protein GGR54DRAFT_308945 [Hypoxylon sp. NC1633]|nr:hypothetical protein GGR54DRAFT_308945 [Hypoxylon sp. NC1633]
MKASAILVSVGAAFAAAQGATFPQGFPQCGITCVNNMLDQASQLGCGTEISAQCLCTKPNFIYGVRDCATESCGDQSIAQQVIQYGSQYCADAGVVISGIPTATGQPPSASTTVVATASPTTTSNPSATQSSSTEGSSGEGSSTEATTTVGSSTVSFSLTEVTGSGGGVYFSTIWPSGISPASTIFILSTATVSDQTVVSTVSTSTSWAGTGGSASASSGSGSQSGSVTTGVTESVLTTNGSTLTTSITTTGTASTQTGGSSQEGSESSTGSGNGQGASSTSNPASQRTAAPVGFIAAAGLAALML